MMEQELELKKIFWDYNINYEEIHNIIKSNDIRKKKWILAKLLGNLKNPFEIFHVFPKDEFIKVLPLLEEKVFYHYFQKRRLKIFKNIYLKENNIIPEAEWKTYTNYKI